MINQIKVAAIWLAPVLTLVGLIRSDHGAVSMLMGIASVAWFLLNAMDMLLGRPMIFFGTVLGPERIGARRLVMTVSIVFYLASVWVLFQN